MDVDRKPRLAVFKIEEVGMQNGQRSESSQDPAEKDTTTQRRRKEIFPAAMRIAPTVEPGAHREGRG